MNVSDKKPLACGGDVMRRTDCHVINNSKIESKRSGDSFQRPPIRNFALATVPDTDPRWGVSPCEAIANSNNILALDGSPLVTEDLQNNIVQE